MRKTEEQVAHKHGYDRHNQRISKKHKDRHKNDKKKIHRVGKDDEEEFDPREILLRYNS